MGVRRLGGVHWRKRDERVLVYLSEGRARYAALERSPDGRLLVLFTHQSEEQEKKGLGDLYLAGRTAAAAGWWRTPARIYEGKRGIPQANGTLIRLPSGRLLAPFAEVTDPPGESMVGTLVSEDQGVSWQVGAPVTIEPLVWAVPYGRPFAWGDDLLMPVYGAMTTEDLTETRLCSGLLRSRDGGDSWGDFSVIAGPDPEGLVSYEFPAVVALPNGTLVAVLMERRLKPRPELPIDVGQVLSRSHNQDGGRTWTMPEVLAVGSWANLIPVDEKTLACSFAVWAAWGQTFIMFSDDGFRTFRERVPVVEHSWLPGYAPSRWGMGYARKPLPLPPVVPYLEGDWKAGHYGFSSGLALGPDRLMVAIGQRHRGTAYTDPPGRSTFPSRGSGSRPLP